MIFFYGTRSSKIAERRLRNTTCPYCNSQDSFISVTFGRYAHFFWVPLFPLNKKTVAECSHCKKTYSKSEFTEQMRRSLEKENEINTAKRPLWHGCGCLIIASFLLFFLISVGFTAIFGDSENKNTPKDIRKELLKNDKNKGTANLTFKTDSISFAVQQCVNLSIEGIDTKKIKYVSKINGNKLMLLLKVSDMKKIKKSSRKELVYIVEECLDNLNYTTITERYIAVDGKWNMLMVKTPYKSNLGGRFANEALLLPFYDTIPATSK